MNAPRKINKLNKLNELLETGIVSPPAKRDYFWFWEQEPGEWVEYKIEDNEPTGLTAPKNWREIGWERDNEGLKTDCTCHIRSSVPGPEHKSSCPMWEG